MNAFEFSVPTRIVVGAGCLEEISKAAPVLGKKGMLIAAKGSMRNTGILDRVVRLVTEAGVQLIVDDQAEPNPTTHYVDKMTAAAVREKCEFVIGLGGGSSIDAAKAIAFVAANGGKMEDYHPGGTRGEMTRVKDALPIIAVTTTAGTGSEATKFAVITNPDTREKPGIGHDSMFPKVSIVDPELMVTVPKEITAHTGIDVLFHAFEAYISNVATPLTDILSAEAINLVLENLGAALEDGANMEARTNMAWANTLAGMAIVQASTVGIHGMGHPIGGHTNAPHGLTMAAIGKAFLEETYQSNVSRYANLTRMLRYDTTGKTNEEAAALSGKALAGILEKFGVAVSLSDLGVTHEMLDQLSKDAFSTMKGCMDASLKPLTIEDARIIYEKSL